MVGCGGLRWVAVGCGGLRWVAVGCGGLRWVSVGFSGFQWVSVGFSGFQWVSAWLHKHEAKATTKQRQNTTKRAGRDLNPRPKQKEKHEKPNKNKNTKTAIRELNPRPPETTAARLAGLLFGCTPGRQRSHRGGELPKTPQTQNTTKRTGRDLNPRPKTKTKRETRKTKQEQEHENSDPGVEPKTTRDDRSAFGRFAVRVHPRTTAKPP